MLSRAFFILTIMAATLFTSGANAGPSSTPITDPYPSSGHDFDMNLQLDGNPVTIPGIVEASIYDEIEFMIESPEGSFDSQDFTIYAQPFTTGDLPFTGLPEFHYLATGSAQVVNSTSNPSDFGTPTFKSGGRTVVVTIPPALAGTKFMLQAFALNPNNSNDLACSRGYELHIID